MRKQTKHNVFFSFFMFTADLRPADSEYGKKTIDHIRNITEFGYSGFDLPVAPTDMDRRREIENYARLRLDFDDAGLLNVGFTTNVFTTPEFDPSSDQTETRAAALEFLKSRVDITVALRATVMAGPLVIPYGRFPKTQAGNAIWSDDLLKWASSRYQNARAVLHELAEYARERDVKLAIEPVDHWETPAPNLVSEVSCFLDQIACQTLGLCLDSAHVVLGSDTLETYTAAVGRVMAQGRLHYVHISAPDRGAVKDSWIPWKTFLVPIAADYDGPYLIEIFNAIPEFLNGLRLTRRKFWVPGEDQESSSPSAYVVAREAIKAFHREIDRV